MTEQQQAATVVKQPTEFKQPQLSQQVQQALATLNVRTNDLLQQVNITINLLIQENQQLKNKLAELQAPVKQTQPQA
jgi:uncharacterized protein YdhG (YjbR/CyaY superfamily)